MEVFEEPNAYLKRLFNPYITTLEEFTLSQNPKGHCRNSHNKTAGLYLIINLSPCNSQHQPLHSVILTLENATFKASASSRREAERQCALDALAHFSNKA